MLRREEAMTMRPASEADYYLGTNGRKLAIGAFVEVDIADDDGAQRFGQLTAGPDNDGIWEYRYISMSAVNCGGEATARAAHYEMGRYHPRSKQTDESRAARRKLRGMGYRIRRSWGDGLVRMDRPDGVTVVRLDGSIRVSSDQVFMATVDMITAGFNIADSKGYKQ
jgi:hypothetical protein